MDGANAAVGQALGSLGDFIVDVGGGQHGLIDGPQPRFVEPSFNRINLLTTTGTPVALDIPSIGPGAIRTPINREAWSTPEAYADLMRLVPYKRIGEPNDIGQAAVWLASDAADYVTGTTLYIDGGMTLYPGFETGG